ncbi:hypothetical protein CVH13_01376 [Dehalococcoides mccartyi]|uniref:Lipoprotein n=1 Tax=Dehalococcoides mccartyi TaxID=61435 RepID=A0A2J1DUI6_9CHLR|nr:hypothetical protein CVH13_01376 [Dehalococcoides mccartyi]
MKSFKVIAPLISLLMLLSLALGSSCSSGTADNDSPDTNNLPVSDTTPTGSQLIASILAASPNITSFDTTSVIDMTMQVSGMSIKTVMTAKNTFSPNESLTGYAVDYGSVRVFGVPRVVRKE